jgi:HEAT repeat protein
VIEALGRVPHAGAIELLARAVDDPAPAVRLAAAYALQRVDLRAARAAPPTAGAPRERARTG